MSWALIGLAVFFAAYIANRFLITAAAKNLSDEHKLKLFNNFAKKNNYATIFILALVLVYFAALQFYVQWIFELTALYLAIYFFYIIFRFFSSYKKLKQLEMPADYMKNFVSGYAVFVVGVACFAFCILREWSK